MLKAGWQIYYLTNGKVYHTKDAKFPELLKVVGKKVRKLYKEVFSFNSDADGEGTWTTKKYYLGIIKEEKFEECVYAPKKETELKTKLDIVIEKLMAETNETKAKTLQRQKDSEELKNE